MEYNSDPYEDKWSDTPTDELMRQRPLGVTILAALQIIATILFIILLFVSPLLLDKSVNDFFGIPIYEFFIIYIFIMIPISLFLAYGLLIGKEWARFMSVLFQLSSIVSSLIRFNIIGLIFPIYIIYYLHKDHVKTFFQTEKGVKLNLKLSIIVFMVIILIFNSYIALFVNPLYRQNLINQRYDLERESLIGTWKTQSENIILNISSDDTCFMIMYGEEYSGTWEYTPQINWIDLYWENGDRDTCHFIGENIGYNCMFECTGDKLLIKSQE